VKYRLHARLYDRTTKRANRRIRQRTVDLLRLRPGDTVLDIGCGTGLSFPLLVERLGSTGRIIGIELAPEMLAEARQRVEFADWKNVALIESAVEDGETAAQADAALFHFTHDIMRSPPALENVFRHLKPGARVAAAGAKWAPWWALPVNAIMWSISRRWVTTLEGFGQPWSHLEHYVPNLRVNHARFGGVYIAWRTAGR